MDLEMDIIHLRKNLMMAVRCNEDTTQLIFPLLSLACPLHKKYDILDINGLIQKNNQSVKQLKQIGLAMSILEKYGRHLMKEPENRSELWRYVKFNNPIFKDRVDALKGGREIMRQMGYTISIQDGLAFPVNVQPDQKRLLHLVTDILLGRKELEVFLQGHHPHPEVIEVHLTQLLRNDLKHMWSKSPGPLPSPTVSASQMSVNLQDEEMHQKENSLVCDICGHKFPVYTCPVCDNKQLCTGCDEKWHNHPKRQQHNRQLIQQNKDTSTEQTSSSHNGPVDLPPSDSSTNLRQHVGIPVLHYERGMQYVPADIQPSQSQGYVFPPSSQQQLPLHLVGKMEMNYARSPNDDPQYNVGMHYVPANVSHPPAQGQGYAFPPNSQQQIPVQLGGKPEMNYASSNDDLLRIPQTSNAAAISPNQLLVHKDNKLLTKSDSDDSYHSAKDSLECSPNKQHPEPGHTRTQVNDMASHSPAGPFSAPAFKSPQMPTLTRSTSKLMPSILAIPDMERRRARVEINLITLKEEIDELESKINNIIVSKQEFYEDEEFKTLNRKKGTLIREKRELENYLSELEEVAEPVNSHPQIFPPSSGSGDSKNYPIATAIPVLTSAVPILSPPDVSTTRQSPTIGPDVLPENQKLKLNMQNINETQRGHMTNHQSLYEKIKFPPTLTNPNIAVSSAASMPANKSPGMSRMAESLEQQENDNTWVCQHCTFRNMIGTKVCSVCSRTTDRPVQTTAHKPAKAHSSSSLPTGSTEGRNLIAEDQDKVYMEKQEAHRRFREKQEAKKNKSSHSSGVQGQEADIEEHYQLSPQNAIGEHLARSPPRWNVDVNSQVQLTSPESKPVLSHHAPVVMKDEHTEHQQMALSAAKRALPKLTPFNSTSVDKLSHSSDSKEFADSLESINERRHIEQLNLDGKKLVSLIKNAEREGFEVDEVEVALALMSGERDSISPINWLHENWTDMVENVIMKASQEVQTMAQNDVGQISREEAKKALIESKADVNKAVDVCVVRRKKQFAEIMSHGNFAREDVLHNLSEYQDIEKTLDHLNNSILQPYIDRIWQSEDQNPSQSEALQEVEVEVQAAAVQDVCNSISNSVVKYEDFQCAVKNKAIDTERRIRMILVEGKLQSWGRAETVIKILDQDLNVQDYPACTLEDVIEAVRNCDGSRSASLVYLSQQCQICYSNYPMSKMRDLGTCLCKLCLDCVKNYFEIAVREKHVRNWTCPNCQQPDLEDDEKSEGYLTFLAMLLRMFVEPDIMNLFHEKLTNWHLQKDPKFRWCTHCGNGSLWEAGERNLQMTCPHCRKKTCFKCKKKWDKHHEGLTCEEYEQWKIDNDPDNQAQGLARHLEANGIDCPRCKMRFDLARGGCIHFTCPECGHQFCSGCFNTFYLNKCRKKSCKSTGLHCHHPRDCFYYLRDYSVPELKRLLVESNVTINETTPQDQQDPHHCPVMEQKEIGGSTKKDEACGKNVEKGCAGLCSSHYKEYLVDIINKNKLDPVLIMNDKELKIFMQRMGVQGNYPSDRQRLIKLIKHDYPLSKKH